MKKVLPFIFLLVATQALAQSNSITGIIVDSLSRSPLYGASVTLSTVNNVLLGGIATDSKGRFTLDQLKTGVYILKASNVGYKTHQQRIEVKTGMLDLKTIRLSATDVKLGEVNVVDKPPLVIVKKDTTEFMADAVQTNKDASAEELIAKMPGVTVQDGKVQAQGEDVKNVLVDGKPFFGDDPNAVLKNIPAEVVERIQVFDKQSEQAEFTGFNDGNTTKTINIVTRLNFRNGTFGKLSGGLGDQERFASGGNINFFRDRQKITLLGQANNTNEQNFASEDLLGVMSSSGGGGRGGGGMGGGRPSGGFGGGGRGGGGMGGGGFSGRDGGNSASDFLVDTKNGLTKTKAAGFNYADSWGQRNEFNSSYFFNTTDNNSSTFTNRDYFATSTSTQKYIEDRQANSQNTNHRFNLRLDYQIDSLNSIFIRPRATLQQNDGSSRVLGNTTSGNSSLNAIENSSTSNLSAVDASSQFLYRRRFETRGRTLSIRLNGTYKKNDGDKKQYSENLYFDNSTSSDTLDQISKLNKNGYSGSANLAYTEPVSDNGMIQVNATYTYSKDESDQKTYLFSNLNKSYSVLESDLSNVYDKNSKVLNYGISYNYRMNELMIMLNVGYNISRLTNEQTFPFVSNTGRTFYSILPSVMLRYDVNRGNNLMFNYRANNNEPSVDQLQNVLDNSNPLQLSIGNPNLAQDSRHNISLRYTLTDNESMSAFFVLFNGTYTDNYIGYKTIIAESKPITYRGVTLNPGTQLRTPENFNGYYNLRTMLTYSFPSSFLKSNLNINGTLSYSKTPNMINEVSNFSKNTSYGGGLSINSNFSKELDFSLSTNLTSNVVSNTSQTSLDQSYLNVRSRIKLYWLFWAGFVFQTDLEHRYQGGLGEGYDPNSYSWNMYIGKKLFADDQGELRITFYDILNKSNNTQRITNDYYIEDTRTNVIGRYFLVSFIYNLKIF